MADNIFLQFSKTCLQLLENIQIESLVYWDFVSRFIEKGVS